MRSLLLSVVLLACADKSSDCLHTGYLDRDGDGFGGEYGRTCDESLLVPFGGDCDDNNAALNAQSPEICDGIDNNCDDLIDEFDPELEGASTYAVDVDGDGYGNPYRIRTACEQSDGLVINTADCDDTDASNYPDAPEDCTDGIDNSCNGTSDCEDPTCNEPACDEDCGDGRDNDGDGQLDCEDDDCTSEAVCMEDCWDGVDNDLDGLVDCEDGDCIDSEACTELCEDGLDNDLDGLTDCEDDDCLWVIACEHPAGVEVTLLGGNVEMHRYANNSYWHYTSYQSIYGQQLTQRSTLSNLSGIVRVLPPGVLNWSTATTSTTCAWSLKEAIAQSRQRIFQWGRPYAYASGVQRSGLMVDEDCRLAGTSFLPVYLWAGQIAQSTFVGAPWKMMSVEDWYNNRSVTSSWSAQDPETISPMGPHGTGVLANTGQQGRRVELVMGLLV